ncbi:MAG: DNA-3-methyladenine glycosylase 2 family protein [Pedosphaera sp.]|nr:DNA-3-methyladenine glycosylase 2 family protein [Pedosphaera sp.]
MNVNEILVRDGLRHLRGADPILRQVIDCVGPFRLKPHSDRFGSLVRSIISQQISGSAAQSIRRRLERLAAPGRITPEKLLRFSSEALRSVGLSGQKQTYLRDLAGKVQRSEVRLRSIARRDDEGVIAELIQVKGIGVWTAQMFLMFSLGRLDVFPHDDLGIRNALRKIYNLPELPDKKASQRIAEPWRPYATIASWYCWRSLELPDFEDG